MSHTSTARQRLWLACLGIETPETITGNECRAMAEEALNSGRCAGPANEGQQRLAREAGVTLVPGAGCREAAGKLFGVLMLRGWVYSVWRKISGEKSGRYDGLSLPADRVLSMARQMEAAGLFEDIQQIPMADEPGADVFFEMGPDALESRAFVFVSGRLPTLPPSNRLAR